MTRIVERMAIALHDFEQEAEGGTIRAWDSFGEVYHKHMRRKALAALASLPAVRETAEQDVVAAAKAWVHAERTHAGMHDASDEMHALIRGSNTKAEAAFRSALTAQLAAERCARVVESYRQRLGSNENRRAALPTGDDADARAAAERAIRIGLGQAPDEPTALRSGLVTAIVAQLTAERAQAMLDCVALVDDLYRAETDERRKDAFRDASGTILVAVIDSTTTRSEDDET